MARMKLKNHSGASKRFRRTGSGKLMRRRSGMRHILTTKSARRKRRLKDTVVVSDTNRVSLSRLMPYS